MINSILSAINKTIEHKEDFLYSNKAFSRSRDWPIDRHVIFQIFREKTTTRHDINTFFLESLNHVTKELIGEIFVSKEVILNQNSLKRLIGTI